MQVVCVPLGTNNESRRVFLVPGLGGQSLAMALLGRKLTRTCLPYTFQVSSTGGGPIGSMSREELVSLYFDALRNAEPGDDIDLVGYCFGAYIACELARLLMDHQIRIKHLVTIQTLSTEITLDADTLETLASTARDAESRSEPLQLTDSEALSLISLGFPPDAPAGFVLDALDVMGLQLGAFDHYQLKPLGLPIDLITLSDRSEESKELIRDLVSEWRSSSHLVRLREIDWNIQQNPLQRPYVEILAGHIMSCISAKDA